MSYNSAYEYIIDHVILNRAEANPIKDVYIAQTQRDLVAVWERYSVASSKDVIDTSALPSGLFCYLTSHSSILYQRTNYGAIYRLKVWWKGRDYDSNVNRELRHRKFCEHEKSLLSKELQKRCPQYELLSVNSCRNFPYYSGFWEFTIHFRDSTNWFSLAGSNTWSEDMDKLGEIRNSNR